MRFRHHLGWISPLLALLSLPVFVTLVSWDVAPTRLLLDFLLLLWTALGLSLAAAWLVHLGRHLLYLEGRPGALFADDRRRLRSTEKKGGLRWARIALRHAERLAETGHAEEARRLAYRIRESLARIDLPAALRSRLVPFWNEAGDDLLLQYDLMRVFGPRTTAERWLDRQSRIRLGLAKEDDDGDKDLVTASAPAALSRIDRLRRVGLPGEARKTLDAFPRKRLPRAFQAEFAWRRFELACETGQPHAAARALAEYRRVRRKTDRFDLQKERERLGREMLSRSWKERLAEAMRPASA